MVTRHILLPSDRVGGTQTHFPVFDFCFLSQEAMHGAIILNNKVELDNFLHLHIFSLGAGPDRSAGLLSGGWSSVSWNRIMALNIH